MQDGQDPDPRNPHGEKLVPTGTMAKLLGISRGTLIAYVHRGLVTPAWTLPGPDPERTGHHRWAPRHTREQLRGTTGEEP